MSRNSMKCNKAMLSQSRSIYDPRKEIFGNDVVSYINHTLDFNLKEGNYACPSGYTTSCYRDSNFNTTNIPKCRCHFVDIEYPSFSKGYDSFKETVMRSVLAEEKKRK